MEDDDFALNLVVPSARPVAKPNSITTSKLPKPGGSLLSSSSSSSSSSVPKNTNNSSHSSTLPNTVNLSSVSPLDAEANALSSSVRTHASAMNPHKISTNHGQPSHHDGSTTLNSTAVSSFPTRKNPKKTEATKTPVIVPVRNTFPSSSSSTAIPSATVSIVPTPSSLMNPSLSSSPSRPHDPSSVTTDSSSLRYQIIPYTTNSNDESILSSSSSSLSSVAIFTSLGLDDRLVQKLVSPKLSSAASTTTTITSTVAHDSVNHVAASSGILRGHLRDGFGLTKPTRVQYYMIPLALQMKSLLVRSETGSGKTLAFLLPVIHHLLQQYYPSDSSSKPNIPLSRAEGGTKVVIISPTRELCAQIFTVLTRLIQPFPFLIPSLLAGGEKRKSEKARLRKGCTIIVATPGRLLDHLRTTESFICNLSTVQYLILDEADRLLDMGFKVQIQDIMHLLQTRNNNSINNSNNIPNTNSKDRSFSSPPRNSSSSSSTLTTRTGSKTSHPVTFLLSATVSTAVKELAQEVLFDNAVYIDATVSGASRLASSNATTTLTNDNDDGTKTTSTSSFLTTFSAPKQLQQTAMIVPLKWRLVTLLAILYQAARRGQHKARTNPNENNVANGIQCKGILFVSTTDGVDFYHAIFSQLLPRLLASSTKKSRTNDDASSSNDTITASSLSTLFPVFRLHGNIPQTERTTVFRTFSSANAGLLIATDVAARGLDLPAIDLIIQADAPSETEDYVHRIGRTARRGQKGSSMLILQPHEAPYLDLLRAAGLDVTQMDTTAALATLSDAEPPFDMVKGDSNSSSSSSSATATKGNTSSKPDSTTNGKRNTTKSLLPFDPDFLDMSVDDAEAMVYAQKMNNTYSKDKDGGTGTGKDFRDPNERDPVTGLTVRLGNLFKYARQARSNQFNTSVSHVYGGGKKEDALANPTGNPLERVAETYAVAWQCFIEEFVLLGLPLSKSTQMYQWTGTKDANEDEEKDNDDDDDINDTRLSSSSSSLAVTKRIPLLPLARSAFLSFVRAYSTHEKKVRHIFHPRLLHLGHAAKAFGLREQPSIASKASRTDSHTVIDSAVHYDPEEDGNTKDTPKNGGDGVSDIEDETTGTRTNGKGRRDYPNGKKPTMVPKKKGNTNGKGTNTVVSRYDVRKQTNDDREASKLHFTALNTETNEEGEPVKKRSKQVARSMSEFDA